MIEPADEGVTAPGAAAPGAAAPGPAAPGAAAPGATEAAGIAPPRARPAARRPAAHERLGAVALYFGYRALASLAVAAPLSVFAAQVVGDYPRGDAILFDPGGLMLGELARLGALAAASLAAQLGAGALLAAALGLVPLAVLLVALSQAGPLSAQDVGGRAARALGPLALLWGVALAAQVTAAALVALPGMKLCAALLVLPRSRDIAAVGVVAVALAPVAAIGLLHDLARAALVAEQRDFYTAVARGLEALRAAPLAAAWACASRGALAAVALAGGAGGMLLAGVGTGPRVAAALAAQLAALAAAAYLRASWLAAALRLIDRSAPAERTTTDDAAQ
ncbi:hypothetical protein WMF04_13465 [Sorangium sp. So ce260]|uniref:hypothetical protein n=1 Tax=Sorangium sp. So ce260 TaxID=3133291 RepID=UPI003F614A5F